MRGGGIAASPKNSRRSLGDSRDPLSQRTCVLSESWTSCAVAGSSACPHEGKQSTIGPECRASRSSCGDTRRGCSDRTHGDPPALRSLRNDNDVRQIPRRMPGRRTGAVRPSKRRPVDVRLGGAVRGKASQRSAVGHHVRGGGTDGSRRRVCRRATRRRRRRRSRSSSLAATSG